jgi:hypothetical protein
LGADVFVFAQITDLLAHSDLVNCVKFSPSSRTLVSGSFAQLRTFGLTNRPIHASVKK